MKRKGATLLVMQLRCCTSGWAYVMTHKHLRFRELLRYVRDLWNRGNPDDIQLLLLTLINAYLAEVPLLQNLRAQVPHAVTLVVNPCAILHGDHMAVNAGSMTSRFDARLCKV